MSIVKATQIAIIVFATLTIAEVANARDFEVFASPMVGRPRDSQVTNASCYFSNVSKETVRIKRARLLSWDGSVLSAEASTCGVGTTFDLAPGATCFIGRTTQTSPLACGAFVDNGSAMRGTIELRKADGSVVERMRLSYASDDGAPDMYKPIASSAIYGSQGAVNCYFTNFGSKPAKLRKTMFVTSTGDKIVPFVESSCGSDGVRILYPGQTCRISAQAYEPKTDRQCVAQVTNKADIRGSIHYSEGGFFYHPAPVE